MPTFSIKDYWKMLTSARVKETNIVKIFWNFCSQILKSVKILFSMQFFLLLFSLANAP